MSLHYAAVAGQVVAADVQLVRGDPRPPVVFLHGVLTSVAIGGSLRAAVPDRSWIAISLPGHHPGGFAASGQPEQLTSESFSAPVEALLDELVGDRQVVVAGWSLGGFSALALAAHYPRRVAALASLAGFARGRLGGITGGMAALAGLPLVRLVLRTGLGLAAEWPWLHRGTAGLCTAAGRSAVIPAEVLRAMHADYARHDPAALGAVLAAISRLDVSPLLKNIAVPAWIAAGENDPVVPVAEARRLATALPRATLTVYREAGHMFFCEWPGVEHDFAAWLERVAE